MYCFLYINIYLTNMRKHYFENNSKKNTSNIIYSFEIYVIMK